MWVVLSVVLMAEMMGMMKVAQLAAQRVLKKVVPMAEMLVGLKEY